MNRPSQAALVDRARSLVLSMHEVERWAYALDLGPAREKLRDAVLASGYVLVEDDGEAKAARYEAEGDALVSLERADLGLVLLQAHGAGTVDRLGAVLEATGFVPQSRLLARAYAVEDPGAPRALTALAHMVVAWDADWADLFLLHLASPDPMARHNAALSTVVAAMSARAREPARTLLAEAHARESFPQLRETLSEALRAVEAIGVDPADAG